ncbi:helicase, partial [SAR202 cluster bacterium AC-409-J13_OGT_754m]|nr:helicase [SAR202 cluster bacterium AC-409-J13_OGT_754m]
HLADYTANNEGQVPAKYKTEDGYALGNWVGTQRQSYRKEKLTEERIQRLEALGIVWEPRKS